MNENESFCEDCTKTQWGCSKHPYSFSDDGKGIYQRMLEASMEQTDRALELVNRQAKIIESLLSPKEN